MLNYAYGIAERLLESAFSRRMNYEIRPSEFGLNQTANYFHAKSV